MASRMIDRVPIVEGEQLQSGGGKRRYCRFPARLKALYYYHVSDEKEGLGNCDVINVSYCGLGIQFKQSERLKALSAITIGIMVKWQFVPINLKGRLRWLNIGAGQLLGGVELEAPLDHVTLLKLF